MFRFYAPPMTAGGCLCGEPSFIGRVPADIATRGDLIRAVGQALAFPAWSGNNFDALWDSIRTLDGIRDRFVMLVHADVPAIGDGDVDVYLELLRDAGMYWEEHEDEHVFETWFPKEAEGRVRGILAGKI